MRRVGTEAAAFANLPRIPTRATSCTWRQVQWKASRDTIPVRVVDGTVRGFRKGVWFEEQKSEEGAGEADETDVAAEAEGSFEVKLDSRFGLRFEFGFGVAPGAGSEDSSVDIVVANERRARRVKSRVDPFDVDT